MNDSRIRSIDDMSKFVENAGALSFSIETRKEKYEWISGLLLKVRYKRISKKEKGIVLEYVHKITKYSKIQLKRLIQVFKREGLRYKEQKHNSESFQTFYTLDDVALLIKTDIAHGCLNGNTTKEILRREYYVYKHNEYEKICRVSVSHIYNIRNTSVLYQSSEAMFFKKTQATQVPIGVKRKPMPNGKPGYIRVDSVHQGDFEGQKGVYHIKMVDEVTQWEVIATVENISEQYLEKVLELMIKLFPFVIIEFHSDNGSEFINYNIAAILNRLIIKQSKSRSGKCNDNALVESKNGSVIRRQFGRSHIPKIHAEEMQKFDLKYFNVYVNFHRPCRFSIDEVDEKIGKIKKNYKETMTPYDKFKSLKDATTYLRPDMTFEKLEKIAMEESDNEFAERMRKARIEMFTRFRKSAH